MFTIDLADEVRGSGVTVNALHPATYMDTTMVRRAGITPWSSVEEGAEAILNLPHRSLLKGAAVFTSTARAKPGPTDRLMMREARQRLKAISLELSGLSSLPTASNEKSPPS